MTRPEINVTPLIDVLLVLLIIFMIVTPARPSRFEARIPSPPKGDIADPHPDSLVVVVKADAAIELNMVPAGSVEATAALTELLRETFAARAQQGTFAKEPRDRAEYIEKTVFIKAPTALPYGSVAKVVDAVRSSGAHPISLQIDELD
jgi:biopolymer transport protein ExbD